MEKVILSKRQADAIEFALNTERLAYYQNPDALLNSHIKSVRFLNELEPLREIDNVTLAKALYVGYDIKKEPTHIDLTSVRIWKADYKRKEEMVERYNICIKELDITISLTKDKNKKTFEKVDGIVKSGGVS